MSRPGRQSPLASSNLAKRGRPSLVPATLGRSAIVAVLGVVLGLPAFGGCKSGDPNANADAGVTPGGLSPEQASRVVAKVGDVTITLGDYAAALERMDPFDRLRYQTPEKRRELLNEMIDLELLAKEAERRGLDKMPEVEEATRQVLRDAMLDELHKTLPSPAEIPAEEVRAYYDAHVADYREPERRRVSAIVTEDEERAKDALKAAQADTTPNGWSKVFYERSLTALADKKGNAPLELAGDLGVVGPPLEPKGDNPRVPQALRLAVFKLAEVGDIYGEVVSAEGKFYVVRLAGKTPAYDRPVAEADRQIRVELLKQRMVDQEKKLDAELRAKIKVEIDEAALAKMGSEPARAPTASPSASAP